MKPSEQIRSEFLNFFAERGHAVVPSDSLVPTGDATLLFTNAGMNQFKDVFLGTGTRPYRRAVDTQKCLRVSGKHNDLEEVGVDTYHHTFFEMLGNWSFGDYFKEEALTWSWELLTQVWGLDPERLYVTVHEGDARLGLEPDLEARAIWLRQPGMNPAHVLYGSSKDNFWMMGDTGPCGPCSEVHYDSRPDAERAQVPGEARVNQDDPQVIEIWNNVFIQYNALGSGQLEPLKAKHVDTGMGFERIVRVIQGKDSNYDTDLFQPLLAAIAEASPRPGLRGYDDIDGAPAEVERVRIALRVVADHLRTVSFAIADGATPGNAGRGYVIRRILRRAVRYGYQTLHFRAPFLYHLVEALADKMGGPFPELVQQQAYIVRVLRAEEESFLETLGTGLQFFERILPFVQAGHVPADLEPRTLDLLQKAWAGVDRATLVERFNAAAARRCIPGEIAFLLHDTYGFPADLTALMAREEGLGVDQERFDTLMQAQKDRARAAGKFRIDHSRVDEWQTLREGSDTTFVGYDTRRVEGAQVCAVRRVVGEEARYEVVLDTTPFYAESGGQVGDTGTLAFGEEVVPVRDTRRQQGRIVHIVDRLPEALEAPVTAEVDAARRQRIKRHHTATHLMHAALREVLGRHVQQKGSLVAPDHLRFDFSHFERVLPDELQAVARQVNAAILRNIPKEEERSVPLQEALRRGAMALFGEKYGEHVRVITFDPTWSVELCGGTHVDMTGEIGLFHFISEGSVAAGIRRVVAVTGEDAQAYLMRELDELERVRGLFRSRQRPSDEEVADLIEQHKRLQKELAVVQQQQRAQGLDTLLSQAQTVEGLRVVAGRIAPTDLESLRTLAETLRDRLGAGAVGVLGTVDPDGEKVYLAAAVSDDVVATRGVQAGKLVGTLAKRVGGGGGGRPTLATAGGRQPEALDATLAAVGTVVRELLA
jgi:alanyl-tRNA synthetase